MITMMMMMMMMMMMTTTTMTTAQTTTPTTTCSTRYNWPLHACSWHVCHSDTCQQHHDAGQSCCSFMFYVSQATGEQLQLPPRRKTVKL